MITDAKKRLQLLSATIKLFSNLT